MNSSFKDYKKVYISVSFDKKDIAKSLGCGWDSEAKSWFYNKPSLPKIRNGFYEREEVILSTFGYNERIYLIVTEDNEKIAQSMGCFFDKVMNLWCVDVKFGYYKPINSFNSWGDPANEEYEVHSLKTIDILSRFERIDIEAVRQHIKEQKELVSIKIN